MHIELANALGAATGDAVTPLAVGLNMPCSSFQLIMWDDGAFEAHLEISPDGGDTWVDYPDASLTASGVIEVVFIGEGIPARLVNASGTVSAILVPLP